jgi:hypothetical protein
VQRFMENLRLTLIPHCAVPNYITDLGLSASAITSIETPLPRYLHLFPNLFPQPGSKHLDAYFAPIVQYLTVEPVNYPQDGSIEERY